MLVAPQFAFDALDSSAGRFWQAEGFANFIHEATERLTALHGDARARAAFLAAPIVLAAYSGGYHPAAFVLQAGKVDDRLRGLILLDALYGDGEKFADWLARRPAAFFVSAYGKAARPQNVVLQRMLSERGVSFATTLPATLTPGSTAFVATHDEVKHLDFVTQAWVADPLKVLLRRISGFGRAPSAPSKRTQPR